MPKLKYLNGAISALKWSVLYPIDPENSPQKKIFYFVWGVYFVTSFAITAAQCVIDLAIRPFDLLGQNVVIMNTVIYLTLFMNFIIFFCNSDRMVNLIGNINRNFVYSSDNGIEMVSMDYWVKLTDKLAFYWVVALICSAAFLNGTLPILFGNDRAIPVPVWFPYDYTISPFYELTYAWQILCQINIGIIYASSDIIYPCMTVVIGQQFKILAIDFKNTFYYALRKCGVPKNVVTGFKESLENEDLSCLLDRYEDIFEVTNRNEFRRINMDYFKKNMRKHQVLLAYCEDLNQIMELFLLTKVAAAFFNILFIAFTLVTSVDQSNTVGLLSYIFLGTIEVFLYTYGGHVLTESADFLWSLYESPWYLCDLELQKTLLMVHMRVSKLIYPKAGNYLSMSLPTFITCMRSVFSYVAVLKELVNSDRSNN